MSRYFVASPFDPPGQERPYEAGALALDNSDPTYGGGGLTLGPQVYPCLVCGAAVLNTTKHVEWHEAQP